MAFIEVILPVPVGGAFTYSLPDHMAGEVSVGSRVIVPFGRRKFYTGIVTAFVHKAPAVFTIKEVTHVLDSHPVVRYPQLKFWEWMAEYYLCSVGDVYNAAVPSGLKIESETLFEANPDFNAEDVATLSEREIIVFQLLSSKGKMSAAAVEKETGFRNVAPLMQKMFLKGATVISESLVNRFRPKRDQYVRLSAEAFASGSVEEAFAKVKGAPKQEKMLLTLIQLSGFNVKDNKCREILLNELIEKSGLTVPILKALVDKGLAERFTKETSRFRFYGGELDPMPVLSDAQKVAFNSICGEFKEKPIVLLHGVTASGKTEVYIHVINQVIAQKRQQVLFLVPEIALTTQLTGRLQKVFGDKLLIYHSKFTDNERVEIWNRLLASNDPLIVLGTRSAVFLPFAKLGLIVVDEEHDQSFKQFDRAPRFNARDAAIMLGHMHGASTLLGSATPSIETYYKAASGKYGLVELSQRYQGISMPDILVTDMSVENKRKAVKGSFALSTIADIRSQVEAGNQAIVFHNRRGFAPMAHCTQCQYVPKCKYCDVTLTFHKSANSLVCHYCGTSYPVPETCPVCKEPSIEVVGYGTERIADEVEEFFPEARCVRMDLDTTRNKNSYEKLISTFSSHKADILVGTQMITKGLDFGDVSIAAVVNADAMIHFPDFRSAERSFNILEQVAGRAGRRDNAGKVIIQTRTPSHPVISFVKTHDYLKFYQTEIEERRLFAYPPFTRLIYIYLKHKDEAELDNISIMYADRLRGLFGTRVSGPAKPSVAKIQLYYIRQIMLKVELNASMARVKEILKDLQASLHSSVPAMRQMVLYYDVDPY